MNLKQLRQFIRTVWKERERAQVPLLSAGLAYYSISALAPLLLIVIGVSGLALGEEQAQEAILVQLSEFVGDEAAEVVGEALEAARVSASGRLTTIIGAVFLVTGATGVFFQLRNALNVIWRVKPSEYSGLFNMIQSYLFGFVLVVVLGILLILSFVASTTLSLLASLTTDVPLLTESGVRSFTSFSVSIVVIALILGIIYRFLPDISVRWKDIIPGALCAAVLLYLARLLGGTVLGRVTASSPFSGAAGALTILLLWIYASAQIVLLGAVITFVYSEQFGSKIDDPHST